MIKKYKFKGKDGIEVVSLEKLTINSIDSIAEPHRVNFYQIYCFFQGTEGILEINFEKIKLAPNTILYVPSHAVCSFSRAAKYYGSVIIFTDFFVNQNAINKSNILFTKLFRRFRTPQLLPLNGLPILELINLMQLEIESSSTDHNQSILLNYLENIVLYSERIMEKDISISSSQSQQQQLIIYFYDLVNTYYKSEKSLQFYCDKLSVNYSTLNKTTHHTLGMSPKTLLNQKIVLEAKSLLAYTDLSIKEICYELGINEPSYFTVFFKKYQGENPREFREKFEKYK